MICQGFTNSKTLLKESSDAAPVASPLSPVLHLSSGRPEDEKLVTKPAKVQAVLKGIKQEKSSAHYILQQYTAASGGRKLQNSIKNAYAMGKMRMLASEIETVTGVLMDLCCGRWSLICGVRCWRQQGACWLQQEASLEAYALVGCSFCKRSYKTLQAIKDLSLRMIYGNSIHGIQPIHFITDRRSGNGFTVFTYNELKVATKGFRNSNKIGEEGIGSVYQGHLKDGSIVAVKVLSVELESLRDRGTSSETWGKTRAQ